MAAKRIYTDEHLDYIKRYWRKYPTKLVAEQLGMTINKVNSIASRHGLKKNKNKARTPLPKFMDNTYLFSDPVAHEYYQAVSAKHDALTPRKNWFQRLVSWLLEGKV